MLPKIRGTIGIEKLKNTMQDFLGFIKQKWVKETIITIALALVLFFALRSVAHTAVVSGISMEPNLHDGQRVIVSKVAYWFDDPDRGDIIVFDRPTDGNDIIHRIVGLPGETAEIKAGQVYINGEELQEPYTEGISVSRPAYALQEDEYLVVGDNRHSSAIDVVDRDDIIGKAWIFYWPIGDWGRVPNHSF